ncbi:MAG: hypothetical protein LBV41_07375 [Cytophagaceae bacterium]|jgi:outer membrane protein OmpA-like peptidoglycan-associated protein|nr:hypothetical protein [Cytophagaceae bacterium]
MKAIIVSLLLILHPFVSMGQRTFDLQITDDEAQYSAERKYNTWALSIGGGLFGTRADEADFAYFFDKVNFSPSIILSKQLAPALAIDLQFLQGNMYGRNQIYSFEGDLYEAAISGTFFINQMLAVPGPYKDKWNFFLRIGAGTIMYRSRLFHVNDNTFVRGEELDQPTRSTYMVTGYNTSNPDEKAARRVDIIVPFTGGVMYRINKSFDVSFEASLHFGTTDHLDNVLTSYSNDGLFFTGLYLHYKFGKKDKRHMRWTYRGLGVDRKGRPKKDPLIDEVARLEDDVAKYAAARPINIHTVEIHESLTTYYHTLFVRSIFFPKGEKKFDDEDFTSMAEMVVKLLSKPEATLELYGYVNENDGGNHEDISRAQCDKIVDILINDLGADASRIKINAKGSSAPLVTGTDASPEMKEMGNRRVDMVIVL